MASEMELNAEREPWEAPGKTRPTMSLAHGKVLRQCWKEVSVAGKSQPQVVAGSWAALARLCREQCGLGMREEPGTGRLRAK